MFLHLWSAREERWNWAYLMELAVVGSAMVCALFCLLADDVDGLTLEFRLLFSGTSGWLSRMRMRIGRSRDVGAEALSLRSRPISLVETGLVAEVRPSWKAVLAMDACVARPPVTLVLVDGVVDTVGMLDGVALCGGEPVMSDGELAAPVRDSTVGTMSGVSVKR